MKNVLKNQGILSHYTLLKTINSFFRTFVSLLAVNEDATHNMDIGDLMKNAVFIGI